MLRCLLLSALLAMLSACSLDDGGRAQDPPPTEPFRGSSGPPSGGMSPPSPPGGTTACATDAADRCNGATWQFCDPVTHRWRDFIDCGARTPPETCSTAPADCAGLVHTACCVGSTTAPPSPPPTAGPTPPPPPDDPNACTDEEVWRCKGAIVQECRFSTHLWENFQDCSVTGRRCSTSAQDCSGFFNIACCTS